MGDRVPRLVKHHPAGARDEQHRCQAEPSIGRLAVFVATDSRDLDIIRAGHVDDTFVPLDPDTLGGRLEAVGFTNVAVEVGDYQLRFNATKPAAQLPRSQPGDVLNQLVDNGGPPF